MAQEIERKFLLSALPALDGLVGERIIQGYVAKEPGAMTTRVRIRSDQAFVTLKGPSVGMARDEYEYPIPVDDAEEILRRYCQERIVCKTRYLLEHQGVTYEIDVFAGRHAGLVVAEVELACASQALDLPSWIGKEVTNDARFGNYTLAMLDGSPKAKWWLDEGPRYLDFEKCCCRLLGRLSCCQHANFHLHLATAIKQVATH